ncbi:MAG TPA: S-layer homology domain-containing protein, partial [Chloroflexia bacterium]|nr:S-layer homology domain-containing protein [Chloroflexia bacterium]
GTTTWNYAWTIPADGAYTLKVRGTDQAGNVQVPTTSITVNVAGSCAAGTSTPVPPSNTPVPPPSNTPVPPAPTDTPVPPLPSNTPVPPAATSTAGVTVTPCAIVFTDVHPTDYFYTPVQALACQGVISGYGDETFRPYNNTTRGQMLKIVVLGFGLPIQTPVAGGYTFADVAPSSPFFSYIETGAARGVVSGYTCGGAGEPCDGQNRPYFRSGADVTRGQLSKIVITAAGWPAVNPTTPTFADVPAGSPFYGFVEAASAHGLVSGYACGSAGEPCDGQNRPYFRQTNPATRGQIAKIVYAAQQSGGGRGRTK